MPRAILTFRLPQEESEHRLALDAHKYRASLCEIDTFLRGYVKHVEKKDWPDAEAVRTKLWEILNENGVDIWSD